MMKVVLGEHNIHTTEGFEQIFSVSGIIRHYNYKTWSFNNDIMLIKVREKTHMCPCKLNSSKTHAALTHFLLRWCQERHKQVSLTAVGMSDIPQCIPLRNECQ